MAEKCVEEIFRNWTHYACTKPVKVQRDGKWYCRQHDPEKVKERRKKLEQKWREKWDARDAENSRLATIAATTADILRLAYEMKDEKFIPLFATMEANGWRPE